MARKMTKKDKEDYEKALKMVEELTKNKEPGTISKVLGFIIGISLPIAMILGLWALILVAARYLLGM